MHEIVQKFLNTKNFKITPLKGDASGRKYFRIFSTISTNFEITNSASVILLKSEDTEANKNFESILSTLTVSKVNVPKLYYKDKSIYFLEDLTDTTLADIKTVDFYKLAINELIKIQNIKPNLISKFNSQKLYKELTFFKNQFFNNNLIELDNIFLDISERLDVAKNIACFCHRDYHSKNIMIYKNEPYIIDFQDAMVGIPQYDLVSLLKDSYTNIEFEHELLEYYFEYSPFEIDKDKFMEIYELQSIQRSLKASASFKSFRTLINNESYLKYIPIALDFALASLKKINKYKLLYNVIYKLRESL